MDTMNLMIAVIVMLLGGIYGLTWIVLGVALIVVASERSLSALGLMCLAVIAIFAFKDVLSENVAYILLGMVVLGMLTGQQQSQQQGMGGGMESLYGMPPGYG